MNTPLRWQLLNCDPNSIKSGGTIAFHSLAMNFKVMEIHKMMAKFEFVDVVKWLATVIQLIGYGMTGLNLIPYNIYMFFIGIFLWFAVGFMWKDRAIMVVHVGAFISLLIGYLNA